jgi:hypothetical protein
VEDQPVSSQVRRTVEERSAGLLLSLHRLPRWVPFVLVLALAVVGLLAHGAPAGIAIIVVFLFASWLTYLAWPLLNSSARLVRVAVLVLLLAAAVLRATAS